jgi:predicted Zn-dependent protease
MTSQKKSPPLAKRLSLLIALLIALTVSLLAPVRADDIELPDIGDPSGRVIDPVQERKIGERLMRRLNRALYINRDPLVQEYIRSLGYRLVSYSDKQDQSFTFFVINDNDINAFAAPGGYIGINRGLILTTRSEDELAAVLAHEIAHITQRHLARTIAAAGRHRLATMLTILAAILVGANNAELQQAAIATGIATSAQLRLNFTRANEKEADRIGIMTLYRAGFDPNSMAAFFQRLQRSQRLYGSLPPEFLSTHPITINRIAEAKSRSADLKAKRAHRNRLNYYLIRARLEVLGSESPHALQKKYEIRLKQGRHLNKTAAHYGYALTLIRNEKFRLALGVIRKIRKTRPDSIPIIIAEADALFGAGKTRDGLKLYNNALKLYPNNRPLVMSAAASMMQSGHFKEARRLLTEYLRFNQDDTGIYKLYAEAASKTGHRGEAHLYLAEYYFANGLVGNAINQLKQGIRIKNLNYYIASRLNARLREIQKIVKEEK